MAASGQYSILLPNTEILYWKNIRSFMLFKHACMHYACMHVFLGHGHLSLPFNGQAQHPPTQLECSPNF